MYCQHQPKTVVVYQTPQSQQSGNGALWIWLIVSFLIFYFFSLHRVEEGHVGVYYKLGELLPNISDPGYSFKLPILTTYKPVHIKTHINQVNNVPCLTSTGETIIFDNVDVVNKLDREKVLKIVQEHTVDYAQILINHKVHHEINKFCSIRTLHEIFFTYFDQIDTTLSEVLQDNLNSVAPGIQILYVSIKKPEIPENIKKQYLSLEAEKAKLSIAAEHEKMVNEETESGDIIRSLLGYIIIVVIIIIVMQAVINYVNSFYRRNAYHNRRQNTRHRRR